MEHHTTPALARAIHLAIADAMLELLLDELLPDAHACRRCGRLGLSTPAGLTGAARCRWSCGRTRGTRPRENP